NLSLTWTGLLLVPALVVMALLLLLPYQWWLLSDRRRVARLLESRVAGLDLALRTCLDFLEGRVDAGLPQLQTAYLEQVEIRVRDLDPSEPRRRPWQRYAAVAAVANVVFWAAFGGLVWKKFYNPKVSFGQTHLNLEEGSITIFE